MELKTYQRRVIRDLQDYLVTLEKTHHLADAFKAFWRDNGILDMDGYKNNVAGVPHVCAKVPTAGGKTFIAVNAIKPVLDAFSTHNPGRPRLVVWLVPSLAILSQTVNNLSDPGHPYRQHLNTVFKGRVEVYEKRELLMGAGFSADTVREQLSIVVMSFDSLRARNKDDRKIYQDNGYLASFMAEQDEGDSRWRLPGYDDSSLINVIRRLNPLVVVDESHNAESALSVEMLGNLNPAFILDLTATPRENSNIVSYVDAMALKLHHMVKLPVIVTNRPSRVEVIESALILRRKLEAVALAEEVKGGRYIRPIVLFQAQPRSGEGNTTYEKVREKLVAAGIPAEQIKIKTADKDELKGVNLMSRDCQVRFIITVNALKEGWDCSFAYVLASLADKSSAVDVEQILGRVLRMPHVQQHGHELLNMSYVITASSKFDATLQTVVKGLNRSGFSDRDYRMYEPILVSEPPPDLERKPTTTADMFKAKSMVEDAPQEDIEADILVALTPAVLESLSPPEGTTVIDEESVAARVKTVGEAFVDSLQEEALRQNAKFEEEAKTASADVAQELEIKLNRHKIKGVFRDDVKDLRLPQFFMAVPQTGWFEHESGMQLFERDELLREFKLSMADATLAFDAVDEETYRVDLEKIGQEDYTPTPFKLDAASRRKYNELILATPRESQVRDVTIRLVTLVGNMFPITDHEVRKYVQRIVEAMDSEQIRDCLERDVAYVRIIKEKISSLASAHAYIAFNNLLFLDKLALQPNFAIPTSITPSANAPSLPKSLYTTEASIGQFETKVITRIVNLDSVKWWHRNLNRGKGFRINGYLNAYPDFIVKMTSGRVVVVETKGDDRDNSDSALKLKLGQLWESKAGSNYKYMMVFGNNPIEGADTLASALMKLTQL